MKEKFVFVLMALLLCVSIPGAASSAESGSSYDVVIVGAGGGGLSAGARLALGGMKVLVIEQHYKVGGYMTTFERGDYTFEVSLHAMGSPEPGGMTYNTFKSLDLIGRVKPIRLDPMYRTVYPDLDLVIPGDSEEYKELLKKTFPHEAKGIDGLFKTLNRIDTTMMAMMGLTEGEFGEALGVMVRPWVYWPVMKYWNATLSEMLDDYVQDEKLIAVFTQLSGYAGAEPDNVQAVFFCLMWASYHYGGYYYFEGGSQSVSDAMADVIEENGGEILLSNLVTKIKIQDGRAVAVRTEDGKEFKCRYVVSNANAPDTFFKLVGTEHLPADYVERIETMKIGLSPFVVYLGVDHDYTEMFHDMHQIMISESYDVHQNFMYVYDGVPEKAGYAIANYSAIDPTAAPAGKNVFQVISMLPYDWKDGWYESESYARYDALKTETAKILIKRAEKFVPDLSKHIEVMEVGSPRTMEHFTLNPKGTIFGWDNIPEQSMMKRLPQETPIENLYLSGAWTFPGGGQEAVMASGVLVGEKILKKAKKRK